MKNEHDANLALVPLPRITWVEPSICKRRPLSLWQRLRTMIGV